MLNCQKFRDIHRRRKKAIVPLPIYVQRAYNKPSKCFLDFIPKDFVCLMSMGVWLAHVSVHKCAVPTDQKSMLGPLQSQVVVSCSYIWLWVVLWGLRIQFRSSEQASRAPNHWALSSPTFWILKQAFNLRILVLCSRWGVQTGLRLPHIDKNKSRVKWSWY